MTLRVDVCIPTVDRAGLLGATLTSLCSQAFLPARVVISDQSDGPGPYERPAVSAATRLLEHRGVEVLSLRHQPRRGLAEQRQYLLEHATGDAVLFLDDDVLLGPKAIALLADALEQLDCGFVGMALTGLSYAEDERPHETAGFTPWAGRPEPERIRRSSPAWDRWQLHNAANPTHLSERAAIGPRGWTAYQVAWVGGCVLYSRPRLLECGGFGFWDRLPAVHCGEDVVAQLAVMERYGGAGILPSVAYHQEAPTTVTDRRHEAYDVLGLDALERVTDLYADRPPTSAAREDARV